MLISRGDAWVWKYPSRCYKCTRLFTKRNKSDLCNTSLLLGEDLAELSSPPSPPPSFLKKPSGPSTITDTEVGGQRMALQLPWSGSENYAKSGWAGEGGLKDTAKRRRGYRRMDRLKGSRGGAMVIWRSVCAQVRRRKQARQTGSAGWIAVRHPTHVCWLEEGSADKAYLITRELNEQKGYTHHLNIVTAHKKGKQHQQKN